MATSPRGIMALIEFLLGLGFPEDNLPNAREDSIWIRLESSPYSLSLPEVSALKNYRCNADPKGLLPIAPIVMDKHPFIERWKALNEIFEDILSRKRPRKEIVQSPRSVAYSCVQWKDLVPVYGNLTTFEITSVPIAEEALEIVYRYISMVVKSIDDINFGKEALRMQFIAPIVVAVCSLHEGVTIVFENDMNGNRIQINGHFEIMIKKGNKRICIVEAKKENMDQGLCQVLLGCEAAVDVDDLQVAYGISTTYAEWAFVKLDLSSDKVFKANMTLKMGNKGMPEKNDLAILCGTINSILR